MDLVNSLNITDKVLFTGPVSEIDKFAAYTDSDVFVTPSFYGFPLTFLEAMACGTPIVTTNKGDFIENIDHKVGYVVEYNEDELANAIYDILTDDLLRDEFKKNCTAFIKQFDWSKIAKDIEEVYCKVSGVVR
jgi:glycosyltransferase involved in cell wall biosynthesis